MDIFIESTQEFENDLAGLGSEERTEISDRINDFIALFRDRQVEGDRKLLQPRLPALTRDYESSLYILPISPRLNLILAIDEDPIFRQIVFTLFRAIAPQEAGRIYQQIAKSLYQDFLSQIPEVAKIS
ncbi:MAG: hypothetical protein AB4290_04910 [Spirulina sp.]